MCDAPQVSALSSQLYEAQVVSEKRLAAAAAQAQAALRAERLELQAEIISLAAKLAAEARQRQELETEVRHVCSKGIGCWAVTQRTLTGTNKACHVACPLTQRNSQLTAPHHLSCQPVDHPDLCCVFTPRPPGE
jgi:hypothetical protein